METKYLLFVTAALNIIPGTALLVMFRGLQRYAMLGLVLPVLLFNQTSINFFSHEIYRGTSRGMEVSAIYLVALTVIFALIVTRGFRSPFPDWGSRLYLLYFVLSLPSFFNAENSLFAVFEVWKMIMIYLVFVAVFYYLYYYQDFEIFMYGFAAIVVINFLVILKEHFVGTYQARGVFPHQNSMSMYMGILGGLFLSAFLNSRKYWRGWFYLLIFLLAAASLFRSYSRGGILCFPIVCMIVVFFSLMREWRTIKLLRLSVLSVIGILGLLVFFPKVVGRFIEAPKSSGEMRRNFAIAAMNMIEDKPLVGVGLNNWGIKINPPYPYSTHRNPKRGFVETYKDGIVETIYLLVAAECGIPCLLALLGWFAYYIFAALWLIKRLAGTEFFYIPVGVLGGISGAYLQSVLEWILKQQINYNQLMIMFAFISFLVVYEKRRMRAGAGNAPVAAEGMS